MAIRLSELNAINGEPAPQKQPIMPQPEQVEEPFTEDENVDTQHESLEAAGDDDIDVMSFPVLGEELDEEEYEEAESAEDEAAGADSWLNAVINRVQDAPEATDEDDSWVDEEISDEDETDYSELIHGDYEYEDEYNEDDQEEEYEEEEYEYDESEEAEYEYEDDEEGEYDEYYDGYGLTPEERASAAAEPFNTDDQEEEYEEEEYEYDESEEAEYEYEDDEEGEYDEYYDGYGLTPEERASAAAEPFNTDDEEEYDYDDQPIEPPPAEFVETDEDGLYILRDEDGDLYPWAEAFIIGLPRLDAMNKLADEDYEIWDSSNGTDTPETPQESTNHQTDEEDTNTPTEEPQQVSVDDAAASATDEPATTIKDRALKVLDALAGFLHKGSRIPLFGHLFAKSIPGTSTGRGLAGVFLALLVFLGGSFINNQIVGDRTFPVAGDSTIMLPDDGKVTATGVERKDGKYFIILKNEGEVTAGTISGAVKAAGSDAYNPAAWFNKENLGSCSFTAEDIPAETEAKAPLTCDTDMKGKGSMEFTDVTLHTEDV